MSQHKIILQEIKHTGTKWCQTQVRMLNLLKPQKEKTFSRTQHRLDINSLAASFPNLKRDNWPIQNQQILLNEHEVQCKFLDSVPLLKS